VLVRATKGSQLGFDGERNFGEFIDRSRLGAGVKRRSWVVGIFVGQSFDFFFFRAIRNQQSANVGVIRIRIRIRICVLIFKDGMTLWELGLGEGKTMGWEVCGRAEQVGLHHGAGHGTSTGLNVHVKKSVLTSCILLPRTDGKRSRSRRRPLRPPQVRCHQPPSV